MPIAQIDPADKRVSCRDIYSIRVFPAAINLSRYFTLGDITRNLDQSSAVSQMTRNDIVCNLRNIAINVLDPIKAQYPDMSVIAGFPPAMPGSFAWAYNRGLGVIIEFTKIPGDDIVPIVAWIRANIQYSQLLLVYNSNTVTGKLRKSIAITYGTTMAVPEEGTILDGKIYRKYLTSIELANTTTTVSTTSNVVTSTATTPTGIGFTGSAGRDGINGVTGETGRDGFTGSTGAGFTGSTGAAGFVGSFGFTGSVGTGFTGSAGSGGASASTTANLTVSEDVVQGDLVNVWNSAGNVRVRKANALLRLQAHGFVLANTANTAVAVVYFSGVNDRIVNTMNVATTQYLTVVAGRSGNAAPTLSGNIVQEVGLAVASNVLIFNPKSPVLLA